MSATSGAPGQTTTTPDEVTPAAGKAEAPPAYSPFSALYDVVATGSALGTVARLTLGIVMFPHAAQKLFGWFGGDGLEGTYAYLTAGVGLPGVIAGIAMTLEIVGTLLLIVGAFTRIAAAGILVVLLGAILTNIDNGLLMSWSSTRAGEGLEFHLLAIGLAIITIIVGGGGLSIDRLLTNQLRPTVDPVAGHFLGGDDRFPHALRPA